MSDYCFSPNIFKPPDIQSLKVLPGWTVFCCLQHLCRCSTHMLLLFQGICCHYLFFCWFFRFLFLCQTLGLFFFGPQLQEKPCKQYIKPTSLMRNGSCLRTKLRLLIVICYTVCIKYYYNSIITFAKAGWMKLHTDEWGHVFGSSWSLSAHHMLDDSIVKLTWNYDLVLILQICFVLKSQRFTVKSQLCVLKPKPLNV